MISDSCARWNACKQSNLETAESIQRDGGAEKIESCATYIRVGIFEHANRGLSSSGSRPACGNISRCKLQDGTSQRVALGFAARGAQKRASWRLNLPRAGARREAPGGHARGARGLEGHAREEAALAKYVIPNFRLDSVK